MRRKEAKRNVEANRIIILKPILHINIIQERESILANQIKDQWPRLEHTAMRFEFHIRGHFLDEIRDTEVLKNSTRQCYCSGA